MTFKASQYQRVEELIKTTEIFNNDKGNGLFRKKTYPFVLQNEINNFYTNIEKEVLLYFEKNQIAWWGGHKPTNHTISSQIACINHLFPIRKNKEAVLAIMQNIIPGIVDVLPITTDKFDVGYIQFESVSDIDHLNEITSTRGSNCTSVDALIYCLHKDGRKIIFPIEWKYAELYGNEDKAAGSKGITRKNRYTELINSSAQLKAHNHEVYYFEPFYQLMRQTLWSEQMVVNNNRETLSADDYIHIHVVPPDNNELLFKEYLCSGKEMEITWRECLKDQNKYKLVSPQDLFSPVSEKLYKELYNYLKTRYW